MTEQQQQQQQQPRTQKVTQATALYDTYACEEMTTAKILNAWSQAPAQVPTTIEALEQFVKSELPFPIPWTKILSMTMDAPCADVIDATKFHHEDTCIQTDLRVIRDRILSYTRHGACSSKGLLVGLMDALIVEPMVLLTSYVGMDFTLEFNVTNPSGTRPDLLVWLPSGVLAFKGEIRAQEKELAAARIDLSKKLSVFTNALVGNLKFQLCYAMGGFRLQFCAMEQKAQGRHRLHCLTDPIDMSTMCGRSLCVRHVVNITRLLIAMHRQDPTVIVIRLGSAIDSPSSSIEILGDHIMKKPKMCTRVSILLELYELIRTIRGVEGLIRVYKAPTVSQGNITLYLEPVGTCPKSPLTLDEVKAAGRQLLCALEFLHDHNWVHRDIQPDNVMFADQSWYLIDLEWANVAGWPLGDYSPHPALTPPEISNEDGLWTSASDMWQFGELLYLWDHLNLDGQNLRMSLQNDDPEARPTAREALQHLFFAS